MRLLSFDNHGAATVGVRISDEVIDLSIAAPESAVIAIGTVCMFSARFCAVTTMSCRPVLMA